MNIMENQRVLVWFSCGAASTIAAKLAIEKYGLTHTVEILYCDTFAYEHPDNKRFFYDVQNYLKQQIKILKSEKYTDIYDVFIKTRWLIGVKGARCTTELKKKPRLAYQNADDIHVFGLTSDEFERIENFKKNNPELECDWILLNNDINKRETLWRLKEANIAMPEMYNLGYDHNNCLGCVKGGAGYWNKIKIDFPEMFWKMAKMERELNIAINKTQINSKRVKIFLDELPEDMGNFKEEPPISCGVQCGLSF